MIMITIIPILLSIIAFTNGEITKINAIEGEDIEFYFIYPCNGSEVTLQQGYKAPFYDSVNPESMSLPENQRLSVNEGSGEWNLTLRFTPALTSDEGGYVLTLYASGRTFLDDTVMWLEVDYPPGTASCEWTGEDIAGDWVSLNCTAPAGSMSGEIACYQNGMKLPYLRKSTKHGYIIEETIWARYFQRAFCCTIVIGRQMHKCEMCKDYEWDPSRTSTDMADMTDPCTGTTPQEQQNDSTSLITSVPVTKQPNTIMTKMPISYVFPFHLGYLICIGILTVVIIGLIIALMMSHRRFSEPWSMVRRIKKVLVIANGVIGMFPFTFNET